MKFIIPNNNFFLRLLSLNKFPWFYCLCASAAPFLINRNVLENIISFGVASAMEMDADRVPDLASPVPNESANHLVAANYSKLSDQIRRLTPQGIQCSVFCGGTNCKYENPENWTADSLAIQGIYSHWYDN